MSKAGLNKAPNGTVRERSDRQKWATPELFVRGIERMTDRPVGLDVCAEAHTAKAPQWFGPGSSIAEDAFSVSCWADHFRVDQWGWCNPPFADIPRWVERLRSESARRAYLLLVPPRTDTLWWASLAADRFCHLHSITGRIRFGPPPNVAKSSPPGGTVLWSLGESLPRPGLPPVLERDWVLAAGEDARKDAA